MGLYTWQQWRRWGAADQRVGFPAQFPNQREYMVGYHQPLKEGGNMTKKAMNSAISKQAATELTRFIVLIGELPDLDSPKMRRGLKRCQKLLSKYHQRLAPPYQLWKKEGSR